MLVTGDGDFTGAAYRPLDRGVRVILLAHQELMATEWRDVLPTSERVDLATHLDYFEY